MSWRNCARGGKGKHYKQGTKRSKYLCSITNRGVRYIEILNIDISTLCENINIDKVILENIDIDKAILENIDSDIGGGEGGGGGQQRQGQGRGFAHYLMHRCVGHTT